jgi:pilus assembly protein CpaE
MNNPTFPDSEISEDVVEPDTGSNSDHTASIFADHDAMPVTSEPEAYRASEAEHDAMANVRPIPRISLQAFCQTGEFAGMLEAGASDRRMAKAHVRVNMGGIAAAIDFYSQAPTPNLLLLESTGTPAEIIDQLDQLSGHCDAGTKVIVVGHVNDVKLYRDLIARGVSEYMVAPVALPAMLSEVSDLFVNPESEPLGRFVAFMGAKGGVGSSTIAHNVAWHMSLKNESDVVLADLDVAFGTANIDFDQDPAQTIADVIFSPDRLDETYLDRILTKCSEHLSLLAAPSTLENVCDFDANTFEALFDLLQAGVPNVAIDMPHTWTDWSQAVLNRADQVVITATPDLACLRNTKLLLDKLRQERPHDEPPLLVLNQVNVPKRPEISVSDFCEPLELEASAVIPFAPDVFGTAANNGQMVSEFEPKSPAVPMFDALAARVTGSKMAQPEKKKSAFAPLLSKLRLGA